MGFQDYRVCKCRGTFRGALQPLWYKTYNGKAHDLPPRNVLIEKTQPIPLYSIHIIYGIVKILLDITRKKHYRTYKCYTIAELA